MLAFGNMAKAVTLGDRRQPTIARADQSQTFAEDQVQFKITERMDINVHNLGDNTSWPGWRLMQMQHSTSMSGAVQHRLYGGINSIQWRPHDVSAIMARFAGSTETAYVPTQRDASTPAAAWEGKATGDVNRTFTFTISSATVDRMGDSVAVEGWKLDNYKRNPVVLWGHDGSMLPVGRATRVWIQNGKLKATAELAPASVSQYADRV